MLSKVFPSSKHNLLESFSLELFSTLNLNFNMIYSRTQYNITNTKYTIYRIRTTLSTLKSEL